MWLSCLYGGVDFSTTSSRIRHLGEVCRLLLLLVVRSLVSRLLLGSSWGHLRPSWAILGLSWGHLAAPRGSFFVPRHRGFGNFIFQWLRSSCKDALMFLFCQGPFLCDFIEDLASQGLSSCGHLWSSKMASRGPNLAPRGPQVAPRWPQGGPNMPQDGSEMPQEASKISPRWPEAPG